MTERRMNAGYSPGRQRGRPRSSAADRAILQATRAIIEESGTAGFSIGEVVARTGVSTATIYRRWPSAAELILEVILSLIPEPAPLDSGSLQGDIDGFLRQLGEALLGVKGFFVAELQGNRPVEPELRQCIVDNFVNPRRQILAALLQRARKRGELQRVPPVETCWDYIVGPLHHRLLIRGQALTVRAHRDGVRVALAALRVLGESPARLSTT